MTRREKSFNVASSEREYNANLSNSITCRGNKVRILSWNEEDDDDIEDINAVPWMLLMNSLHFILYLHPNQAKKNCGSLRSEPVQNLNRTLDGPDQCSVRGSPIFPELDPRSGLGFGNFGKEPDQTGHRQHYSD
jgi:hypothetical protein